MDIAIAIVLVLLTLVSLSAYLGLIRFLILLVFFKREYDFYTSYREKTGKKYNWFLFSFMWPRWLEMDYRYARAQREFFGESRLHRHGQIYLMNVVALTVFALSLIFALIGYILWAKG